MKKVKEFSLFFIVCYVACFITKVLMHKFTFSTDYLIDSFFIALGATIGWSLCTYLMERKK